MEATSAVADIAYDIENWLYKGWSRKKIEAEIIKRQDKGKFPQNLDLAEVDLNKGLSICSVTFVDKNTGEAIVGFAGTNQSNEGSGKDIEADIEAALGKLGPHSPRATYIDLYMKKLKSKGYNVTTTTGHSLGGNYAVVAALLNDIPMVVTYNGAPLGAGYDSWIEKYEGQVIRIVSDNDPVNIWAERVGLPYVGQK